MPTFDRRTTYGRLKASLDRFPLRYIEEHTAIGKNRLHALRRCPADIKLHELVALHDARFLTVMISDASGTALRRSSRQGNQTSQGP